MSVWTCSSCSARYSVGAPCCPQCGSTKHEDGDTVSGPDGVQGQRYVPRAYEQPVDVTPPPVAEPAPAAEPVAAPVLVGEQGPELAQIPLADGTATP